MLGLAAAVFASAGETRPPVDVRHVDKVRMRQTFAAGGVDVVATADATRVGGLVAGAAAKPQRFAVEGAFAEAVAFSFQTRVS